MPFQLGDVLDVVVLGERKIIPVNLAQLGGTEAINGLVELHRRVARGFRNLENYRLRMLLIGGGLRS